MSLKKIFKRFTPHQTKVRTHQHISLFGTLLHDPNIWHITRSSSAGAVANGLFWAFIPFPGQSIFAATTAIWFRVNLPISLVAVWLTNPVTIYPIFLAAYKFGGFILNQTHPYPAVDFTITWEWFGDTMLEIWQPLLLGCIIIGGLSALFGYCVTHMLWRFTVIRKWKGRKKTRPLDR